MSACIAAGLYSQRVRVLAVGNMYPPHHFGGYELVWRAAMRHLESSGHEVQVLTTDLDTGTTEPDDANVRRTLRWYWRDHGFPPRSRTERARIERHNARVLCRELRRFRPDVVSWWSMGGMSLSMLERVRRKRVPAVAFVHDDWLDYGRDADGWYRGSARLPGWAVWPVERLVGAPVRIDLARAARYVFVSETTRRRAVEAGVAPASTGIAHSGIDPSFLDSAPEREWSWSLLYVGRLDERKGVDTAVEALAHLPEQCRLTLVGGWDEREEGRLRERAAELGVLERVHFAGQKPREEVRAAYAEADAVLFPVRWEEPWGLVPLEAMARGRPVVATGRGGSGEYLRDGENALLSEAGDPSGLAAAVRRLAGDAALRARLREAGFETAERHTEDHFNAAVLAELAAEAHS
jgi:glycogen(starch) synthase